METLTGTLPSSTTEEALSGLDVLQWLEDRNSDEFSNATLGTGYRLMLAASIIGVFAAIINITFLCIIILHRRKLLKHVFYQLIANFVVVDTLRGLCLILFSTRILMSHSDNMEARITWMKIHQMVNIIARSCNVTVILNLVVMTINEYIYISFPLRYHQLVTQRGITIVVILTWAFSLAFGIAETVLRNTLKHNHGMMVNVTSFDTTLATASNSNDNVVRADEDNESFSAIHGVFTISMLVFCHICIVLVISCYASFLRTVNRIRQSEAALMNSVPRYSRSSTTSFTPVNGMEDNKLRLRLLQRYKYALVIGMVIFVYTLYLMSYSVLQITAFVSLNQSASKPMSVNVITRQCLLLIWGIHAAIQPLCYFRISEIRIVTKKTFNSCFRRKPENEWSVPFTSAAHAYLNAPVEDPLRSSFSSRWDETSG